MIEEWEAKSTGEDKERRKKMLLLEQQLAEIAKRKLENALLYYVPYKKQLEFHRNGATYTERLLMAANRVGKTMCGGAEIAMHLTGRYPKDWPGRKYDRPVRGWAAGVTAESTRDVVQRILLGETANGIGTGMIPRDCLDPKTMTLARGVSGLYDTILVKHVSGGYSELKFKSYERGQEKWQGDTLDFVWFDEEPPPDIYSEGYTRIITTNGFVIMTFTPLQGRSDVVKRFLDEESPYRRVTTMTIDDAEHLTPEKRAEMIAGYRPHELEARTKGIPVLGSGKIFQHTEASIFIPPFSIPDHWSWLWSLDFGMTHPFAAVLNAYNRDTDTIYVTHEIRMANAVTLAHASAMKPVHNNRGWMIPAAWPHDGEQRKEFQGEIMPLQKIYKKHGVNMLPEHSTFPDGSNSTELGIMQMDERMGSNRYKVFNTCTMWRDEYRLYHRVDGQINKVEDDLMSASRHGVVSIRKAKPVLYVSPDMWGGNQAQTPMAKDVDISPF